METPETRTKLADAIRQLQTTGRDTEIPTLVSAYKLKYQSPISQQPVAQTDTRGEVGGGLIGSALKTLVVKPALRFGQALGSVIAPVFGATPEGIARQSQQPVAIPIGGGEKITVEPQKALGEGGGTQIFSDALKSATYLAPYGKIASGTTKLASGLVGEGASRIAGGIVAGGVGGYTQDVAQNLDEQKKITTEVFKPGFATLLGGATGGILEGGALGIQKLSQNASQLSKELQQQSLKLTPTETQKLGTKLDRIVAYANDNIPAGKPEVRYAHAEDLYQAHESDLQFFLDTVAKENRLSTSVKKETFIRQLNSIKGAYKYERDAEAIYKQIDSAIATIRNQYKGETIPVDKLNVFKRSTYENAYNKAGDKVLDFVEHDIGDAARLAIERAVKGGMIAGKTIGQFNQEYGDVIQLRKILRNAVKRPEIGFTKRIAARIIGGVIGHAMGGIAGLVGGELLAEPISSKIVGTQAKTTVAGALKNIKPRSIAPIIPRLPTAFGNK